PGEAGDHLPQQPDERLAVDVVGEEHLVARGKRGDVVDCAVELVTGEARHRFRVCPAPAAGERARAAFGADSLRFRDTFRGLPPRRGAGAAPGTRRVRT